MRKSLLSHEAYNNQLFKKYLPIYDFSELLLHTIRRSVISYLPAKTQTVLDVACGTGTQLLELAKKGYSVTGIDLSPDMLAKAEKKLRKYQNALLLCQDATQMPFPDNTFDVSLISFGLHDMPEDIAIRILKEMKRVTRKDGHIFIVDYVTKSTSPMSRLTYSVAQTWESRYYPHFVQHGLSYYMEKTHLTPMFSKIYFRGITELNICKNR